MNILLIATGELEPNARDPLSASLSAKGRQRAARAATAVSSTPVGLLCVASDLASGETGDAIAAALQPKERWDLAELEPLNRDDLTLDPAASPLPSRWPPELLRYGHERLWVRVTPTWARIEIYAQAQEYATVAIVADALVATMLLLSWQGSDWRALPHDGFAVSAGTALQVRLGETAVAVEPLAG